MSGRKRGRKPASEVLIQQDNGRAEQHVAVKRRVKSKQQSDTEESLTTVKHFRPCEKSGCKGVVPICFVGASDRCAGSGYTSRWYHLSQGEHFCNECFEYYYRSHKDGYSVMNSWKRVWSTNGRSEPNMKTFMADQMLPYWMQCTVPGCGKWRQLTRDARLTPHFISGFQCGMNVQGLKRSGDACAIPEDWRVQQVKQEEWMNHLVTPPYLEHFPDQSFLQYYFPDSVGLSASLFTRTKPHKDSTDSSPGAETNSENGISNKCSDKVGILHYGLGRVAPPSQPQPPQRFLSGLSEYIQPFRQPEDNPAALCYWPETMDPDELAEFPEFKSAPTMYLAVRNLVLATWATNFKEWVSLERCAARIIVKGLVRISCISDLLPRVLDYFTRQGIVNFSAIAPPAPLLSKEYARGTVCIIGAGAAGLAAARQLHNFGTEVTVLEAQDHLGGRVREEADTIGVWTSHAGQVINGCRNNPFILLSLQLGLPFRLFDNHCELLNKNGSLVDLVMDRRMDFHFNAMLDNVAEWRKKRDPSQDASLLEKIGDMHKQFKDESHLTFTKEEEELMAFSISNLEFACGCDLSQLSAMSWDQNEVYPQFGGPQGWFSQGFLPLLTKLADGLDVRLNQQVCSIDYSEEGVKVMTSSGQEVKADHVVVSVPLTVLKKGSIQFTPPLPETKLQAVQELGAGCVEKVILRFPHRFWTKTVMKTKCFGCVPAEGDTRGLFDTFHDVTPEDKTETCGILASYLSGPGLEAVRGKDAEEIVNLCVNKLNQLFPEEVPAPESHLVTNWRDDRWSGMAYSYIPVGSSSQLYNSLADDIDAKVFFAGEATNSQHPQTVTGAFMSGMKAAFSITECLWYEAQKDK